MLLAQLPQLLGADGEGDKQAAIWIFFKKKSFPQELCSGECQGCPGFVRNGHSGPPPASRAASRVQFFLQNTNVAALESSELQQAGMEELNLSGPFPKKLPWFSYKLTSNPFVPHLRFIFLKAVS